MMKKNKIDSEIDELKDTLKKHEDADYLYMGEEMKELRHLIIYVHGRIESSIDQLYLEYVFDYKSEGIPPVTTSALYAFRLLPATTSIGFRNKLDKYLKCGVISEQMNGKFGKVNTYRNWFSHRNVYKREIAELKENKNQQKAVLQILTDSMELLK